ncbi:MAG: efflux RND transporter periplasmic adaptor subunit [Planctomycetes bacterium]|nr:efflux RND transporter periplasmic adaptor subunit [Planctomycetota bacterium]
MKLWLCAGTLVVPLCLLPHSTHFSTQAATPQHDAQTDTFDGRVGPSNSVLVAASKDGILIDVALDVGAVVAAGDPVARLDPRVDALALALAEERLASTADEARARATIADIDERVARRAALYDEKLLPESERDDFAQRRRLAEVDLLAAAEKHRLAALERDRALLELERDTVVAPIAGVVVERLLAAGEYVGRSQPAIVRIAALDPLRVEVTLPLRLWSDLHVGDRADVEAESEPGRWREARVTAVSRSIDTASATFVTRLELPNPNLALPTGLRCRVRLAP